MCQKTLRMPHSQGEKKNTCTKNSRNGYFQYLEKKSRRKKDVTFMLKNKIQGYPISNSCAKAAFLDYLSQIIEFSQFVHLKVL